MRPVSWWRKIAAAGRSAAHRRRKDPGSINRAVAVRESLNEEARACRWDPEEEGLWMRVLYCDWMPAEGWQFQRGLSKTWFRPASPTE